MQVASISLLEAERDNACEDAENLSAELQVIRGERCYWQGLYNDRVAADAKVGASKGSTGTSTSSNSSGSKQAFLDGQAPSQQKKAGKVQAVPGEASSSSQLQAGGATVSAAEQCGVPVT